MNDESRARMRGFVVTDPLGTVLIRSAPSVSISSVFAEKVATSTYYGSAISHATRGSRRVYAEARLVGLSEDGYIGIGIALEGINLDDWIGSTPNSVGWFYNDVWYYGEKTHVIAPDVSLGDWLGIALDRVDKTIRFRNITTDSEWTEHYSVLFSGSR